MKKEKQLKELEEYFDDIRDWVKKGDLVSAQKMISGLRRAVVIWKKEND